MQMLTALHAKHRGITPLVFGFVLVTISVISFAVFFLSQVSAPTPRTSTDKSTKISSDDNKAVSPLAFSPPTKIRIPTIDVESNLITVGKNPDGTIEVPGADNYNYAAWYRHSPTPGQLGSSIIEGHVDFVNKGPAIFFRLGELKSGDIVSVDRQDGIRAEFRVEKLAVYKKDAFPTEKVYGSTNKSTLVLITCGGDFNSMNGEYDSNIVVYSSLIKSGA